MRSGLRTEEIGYEPEEIEPSHEDDTVYESLPLCTCYLSRRLQIIPPSDSLYLTLLHFFLAFDELLAFRETAANERNAYRGPSSDPEDYLPDHEY